MRTDQPAPSSTDGRRRTLPAGLARWSVALAATAMALAPGSALAAVNGRALRSALVLPTARQCIAAGALSVEVGGCGSALGFAWVR